MEGEERKEGRQRGRERERENVPVHREDAVQVTVFTFTRDVRRGDARRRHRRRDSSGRLTSASGSKSVTKLAAQCQFWCNSIQLAMVENPVPKWVEIEFQNWLKLSSKIG